jgi:hypothetical protein
VDGHRFQVFLTDQPDRDLSRLELRHRQRARVQDRIRAAKATGLGNLPFDRFRRNAVWLELVLAAQDLVCFTQTLLLDGALAIAEPQALRYRLLHVAARVVRHARRVILRLQATWHGRSRWPARSLDYGPSRSRCAADRSSTPNHLAGTTGPSACAPTLGAPWAAPVSRLDGPAARPDNAGRHYPATTSVHGQPSSNQPSHS